MKRRFSDEQIIGMIKEYEAGAKAQEVCRKYGISDATFYKYKARFGGMNVSDAKKLRVLEDENNRLKRMLAEARRIIETWRIDYNINRPHTSLNGQTPTEFAQRLRSTRPASLELRIGSAQPVLTTTQSRERNRNGFYT